MRQLKISHELTNRTDIAVDRYLQDISKYKQITASKEVELAQLIRSGSRTALEELTNANLRFVVSVAKQYQNQGLELPDLINEGNIGLVKAAERFDETRGFKFISYAVWWIRQTISKAIAEHGRMIYIPLNKIKTINKIRHANSKLEQIYFREPTFEEISNELDVPEQSITEHIKLSSKHISLDSQVKYDNNDTSDTLIDHIVDETDDTYESINIEINRSLNKLPKRDALIIKLHFGLNNKLPKTHEEIAKIMHITQDSVYIALRRAIMRLKRNSTSRNLKKYI